MAEATNQQKLDHLISQLYKQDFWSGQDPASIQARGRFIEQLLTYNVQVGNSTDVTSLLLFLKWYPAGLDNVYRAVLAGNAQTAVIPELVKALAGLAVPGSAAFDQEAFLDRLKGIVDASVDEGLDSLRIGREESK